MEQEIWKEIPGWEGRYEASDLGNVRCLNYLRTGRTQRLKPYRSTPGYTCVKLHRDGAQYTELVHRLVWQAFHGPIPEGKEINHSDGDKANNRLANLETVTHQENIQHARMLLGSWGRPLGVALPTERDKMIRTLAAAGWYQRQIAQAFGISQPLVQYIVSGKVRPDNQ